MTTNTPKVEVILERARIPAGRERTIDVLLRITPPEPVVAAAKARTRLNLALVLDRSGSMEGEKMRRAREAAQYCVDQLLPSDRVSVVVFDEHVEVAVPSCEVRDKRGIKSLIAEIGARGMTALHEAWVRGGMQVSEHLAGDAINRVLLITDGLANVGETNTDRIVDRAKGLATRGVSTSTIGIGTDFNEDLLVPIAEAAGGNAWHVERAEDMQRIFAVELEGLIAQTAHTVTLGLIPSDGVRLVDVLNDFEVTETGRYKLPNLLAGSALEVVVQLRVPAQNAGTRRHLLDLKLGYTPQDRNSAEVLKLSLEAEFDSEAAVEQLAVNHDVVKAVQLLTNARARREAMRHMDAGHYDLACEVVSSARSATLVRASAAPQAQVADYHAESEQLSELEASLGDRSMDGLSRKRLSYQSYMRRSGREKK